MVLAWVFGPSLRVIFFGLFPTLKFQLNWFFFHPIVWHGRSHGRPQRSGFCSGSNAGSSVRADTVSAAAQFSCPAAAASVVGCRSSSGSRSQGSPASRASACAGSCTGPRVSAKSPSTEAQESCPQAQSSSSDAAPGDGVHIRGIVWGASSSAVGHITRRDRPSCRRCVDVETPEK